MTRSRARPSFAERLPLSLRLPNAPPIFVGREQEAAALEATIRRAPLACVWGLGGLGKSALTFHVLHTRFPAEVPRTLVVRILPDGSLDQALLSVAKTLADIHHVEGIDWRSLIGDRDALVATAIDLCEGASGDATAGRKKPSNAFWVVLDDVHHADPARAAEVAGQLARYARDSRWIMVGRTSLAPPEALGQAVALGPMPAEELRALGDRWGMSRPIDDRLLGAAAGSPWRLGQLLRGAQPGLEPGASDLLAGLSSEVAGFLTDLSLVQTYLSFDALARFTERPPPEVLDAIERRGLIERRPGGVRLHDAARPLTAARLDPAARRARKLTAARALLAVGDGELSSASEGPWLEGIRLLVEEGELDEAARALDDRGAALIEAGHAPSLWRVLEKTTAGSLASWRLRCATEIGDPAALRDIPLPRAPSPADRTRWAMSLFQQARFEEAESAGAEARAEATQAGDLDLASDAGRIIGRAAMGRGLYDRALEAFEARAPTSPRKALLRDADLAACLVSLGRHGEALAKIRAVEARVHERPELGDGTLYYGIAWVLYALGAVRLAERAAERLTASIDGVPILGMTTARRLILQAGIALDRGALDEASDLVDKLVPFTARAPVDALFVVIQRTLLRFTRGLFDGLRRELERLIEAGGAIPREDLVGWGRSLEIRLAIALGEPPAGAPLDVPANRSGWEDQLLLWDILHRVHWGREARDPELVQSNLPEVQILARMVRAWSALIPRGRPDEARALAREAVALAEEHGYGLLEIQARACEAVACHLSDAPSAEAAQRAAALAKLAQERGIPPLVAEAELLALVTSPEAFDPVRLEAIADATNAPVAARRARALLGEGVPLDRVDEAVIRAAERRLGCRVTSIGDRVAGSAAGWGLDERTKNVWLPGRSCPLADRPLLWRILTVIADAGGAVDKEALVIGAWGQRDYHPLRDDARLHTAIRTLRRLIEDEPGRPTRLITTEEGYAFGREAPARRVVLA